MPISRTPPKMFDTRSHAWREVGLSQQTDPRAVKRARIEVLLLIPLFVGVVLVYEHRQSLLGVNTEVRVAAGVVVLAVGWAIARDIGRALGPALFRRLDPATAGTVGFLIRLVTVILAILVALSVAGIDARTLALGGAFTV